MATNCDKKLGNGSADLPKPAVVSSVLTNQKYILPRENIPKHQLRNIMKGDHRAFKWICTLCYRGFKELNYAEGHITNEAHMIKIEEEKLRLLLTKLPPPSDSQLSQLTEFVERVFDEQSAARNGNLDIRRGIASELQDFLVKQFPDVEVSLHGSSQSGFALLSSDVNVNVSIPESVADLSQNNISSVMKAVANILKKERRVYSNVQEDYYSFNRIPRIFFLHKKSKLIGEVRINVGCPLSLSYILSLYQKIDSRVLKLGIVFRYWAKICHVDCQEDGHYPAHMFIVMVIYYLQQRQPPVVPVLHEVFPQLQPKDKAAGEFEYITPKLIHELSLSLSKWKSSNSESLGQLWLGLLKYYIVDFPVEKRVASILQLSSLSRDPNFWGSSRLAVQDPMIPRSNMARASSNDKVFQYLWSTLTKSTVYFGEPREFQVSSSVSISDSPLVGTEPNIMSEDDSIVHLHVLDQLHISEPSTSAAAQGIETPLSSEGCSSPSLTSELEESKKIIQEEVPKMKSSGDNLAPLVFKYQIKKEKLVFHNYPIACLGCKKMNHNIQNCPSEKLPPWQFPKAAPNSANLKCIREAFKKYQRTVTPREEELHKRDDICDMILGDIRNVIPDAELNLFGSSANGFGSCHSDLDICLTLPKLKIEEMDKPLINKIIDEIAGELARHDDYADIVTITTARVPIIKLYLPGWSQDCDISLDNRLALRNTKMIAAYAHLDSRVQLLGYAVKHFAKVCDIGDASSGSLSSYAYILMLIHYLQRTDPPVIPCLQQIPEGHPKSPMISNWNCYYYENSKPAVHVAWSVVRGGWNSFMTHRDLLTSAATVARRLDVFAIAENIVLFSSRHILCKAKIWPLGRNQESVGQLWLGFLRYYLSFDWSKEVVTIRQLEPLSKFDKWWLSKLMCIEDPFNLNHNLAASVGFKMRIYILERFYYALIYHSKELVWQNIDHLMDRVYLVGHERAPKFLICNYCNLRGHKQATCPKRAQDKSRQPRKGKPSKPSKLIGPSFQAVKKGNNSQPSKRSDPSKLIGPSFQAMKNDNISPPSTQSTFRSTPMEQNLPNRSAQEALLSTPGIQTVTPGHVLFPPPPQFQGRPLHLSMGTQPQIAPRSIPYPSQYGIHPYPHGSVASYSQHLPPNIAGVAHGQSIPRYQTPPIQHINLPMGNPRH